MKKDKSLLLLFYKEFQTRDDWPLLESERWFYTEFTILERRVDVKIWFIHNGMLERWGSVWAVVILGIDSSEEDAEEESYSSVEDESGLQAVFEFFREKFKEEFSFIE